MQSTSKITLAQYSKMHPIKTLNGMLIIMFLLVPFHQAFQSQIYNSSITLWTSLILIAGKSSSLPPSSSALKILTEFMDNQSASKSARLGSPLSSSAFAQLDG